MKTRKMNTIKKMNTILILVILLVLNGCSNSSDDNPIPPNNDQNNDQETVNFISSPITSIPHNEMYRYQFNASSSGDLEVSYDVTKPAWLNYNSQTNEITGIADWGNENTNFTISIRATNGVSSITQTYQLAVVLGEIICSQNFGNPNDSRYILPFNEGESYLLSQSYCPTNPALGHHDWFAYDFDMDINTPLLASRAGEVIGTREFNPDVDTADCSGGAENYVFILHNDGTVMSYVHLTQNGVEVSVGDFVEQGDLIGYSGNSGCTIGPHTHIALFRNRFNYDRQSTIPLNYSNTDGQLNTNNGLIQGEFYMAL